MKLSIIIISYNERKLLKENIDSLEKFFKDIHEIIIFDNNSNFEVLEYLDSIKNPKIKILYSKENIGFGAANNQAIKISSGDLYFLLNQDSKLISNPKEAEKIFMTNNNIGILGALTKYPNGVVQETVGNFRSPIITALSWMPFIGRLGCLKKFEPNSSDVFRNELKPVDWVSGCSLFIKKEAWNTLNGFNEKYFMYMEDYDLCFRSRNKGFDVMFTKNIQTIHHLSSGKKWIGKRALKWTVEGYKIFFGTYYSQTDIFMHSILLKIIFFMRYMFYLFIYHAKSNEVFKEKSDAYREISENITI